MNNKRVVQSQHLAWLEGIRFLGVVVLLLYHAQLLSTGYAYTPQPIGLLENLQRFLTPVENISDRGLLFYFLSIPLWFGFQFVDVFVLLSGFCLALSQDGKPLYLASFLKRRLQRLLFPFWTVAWLTFPVLWAIGTATDMTIPGGWQIFGAVSFPLLTDFSGEQLRLITSAWGLMPLILSFALLSPFLWFLLQRWGAVNLLMISTLLTLAYRAMAAFQWGGHPIYVLLEPPTGTQPFLLFAAKLSTFVTGMTAGYWYCRGKGPIFWQPQAAFLLGIVVYALGFVCQFYQWGWVFSDLLIPIGLSLCCMVCCRAVMVGWLKPLVLELGAHTFSYFLVSSLVVECTIKLVIQDDRSLYTRLLPVMVVGTLVIALLINYVRPTLQRLVLGLLGDLDYVLTQVPRSRRRTWTPQVGDDVFYQGKVGWTVLKIEKLLDEREFFLCKVSDGQRSLWVNEDDLLPAGNAYRLGGSNKGSAFY